MTFRDFVRARDALLADHPEALDLTETDVARAFGTLRPTPVVRSAGYRCDVARQWLAVFGLPASWNERTLVSEGVRHSLRLLFSRWAREAKTALLPRDVYPVYGELAMAAGLRFESYATVPSSLAEGLDGADVAIVANPVNPRGSFLADDEVRSIEEWLRGDDARRVVVDAVYTFSTHLDARTMALFSTGQAIVLHSMSKGWAAPSTLGIALVPESDAAIWIEGFRAEPPMRDALSRAAAMLEEFPDTPNIFARALDRANDRLKTVLSERGVRTRAAVEPGAGYQLLVEGNWNTLLVAHGVLALPFEVFGSDEARLSVVTSLRFVLA